jgi:hypothetical protein
MHKYSEAKLNSFKLKLLVEKKHIGELCFDVNNQIYLN